ncbi:MAG: hypothetical protein KF689_04435 [Gemmatimonadaceae bacterium]|nr:hypothetical protein [Gemmatimonadaceae bacterium]MCW5825579.1 hypothetical protein [Gemmatimonadaceae bacterium]
MTALRNHPRRLSLTALAALLISAAACDGTAPTAAPVPPPPLPEPLRRELVEALSQIATVDLSALLYPGPTQPAGLGTPPEFFVDTVPCPLAGVNVVTGLIDFGAPNGTIVFDFRDDFRACATPHAEGREWRFTADTPLRNEMTILPTENESDPWLLGSVTGRLRFEVDSLDSRCEFALAIVGIGAGLQVSGSACGSEVAVEVDAALSTPLASDTMSASLRTNSYFYAPRPTGRGSRGVRR